MRTKLMVLVLLLAVVGCKKTDIVKETQAQPTKVYSYIVEVKEDGRQVNSQVILVTEIK